MGTSAEQLSDRGIDSGATDDVCHFAWNEKKDSASEKRKGPEDWLWKTNHIDETILTSMTKDLQSC